MGKASSTVREIRLVITDGPVKGDGQGAIECYVHCDADGDVPLGVQGWHYKVFPAHVPAAEIFTSGEIANYMLWPQKAPERN